MGTVTNDRSRRLYRQTHATFEDYCRERWGLKQSRAYQLTVKAATDTFIDFGSVSDFYKSRDFLQMDAAQAVGVLKSSTIVELPATESKHAPSLCWNLPNSVRRGNVQWKAHPR